MFGMERKDVFDGSQSENALGKTFLPAGNNGIGEAEKQGTVFDNGISYNIRFKRLVAEGRPAGHITAFGGCHSLSGWDLWQIISKRRFRMPPV